MELSAPDARKHATFKDTDCKTGEGGDCLQAEALISATLTSAQVFKILTELQT